MEGVAQPMITQHLRTRDRFVAGFLLILLVIGSLVLWIGIPVATLWALSKVTESSAQATADSVDVVERDPQTNVSIQAELPTAGESSATAPNSTSVKCNLTV